MPDGEATGRAPYVLYLMFLLDLWRSLLGLLVIYLGWTHILARTAAIGR